MLFIELPYAAKHKELQERWLTHLKSTLFRPALLIDEAQEMWAACLNELRLLTSANLDSKSLLTAIISGDLPLPERLRARPLVSLGTRVRVRLNPKPSPGSIPWTNSSTLDTNFDDIPEYTYQRTYSSDQSAVLDRGWDCRSTTRERNARGPFGRTVTMQRLWKPANILFNAWSMRI